MKHPGPTILLAFFVPFFVGVSALQARDLTFEERIAAQEAIERVYYSHQIGATRPFHEAVPREVLEKKVRTYLEETAALARFWQTPLTSGMLREEMERMARQSRMPDRLRELFAALGNDTFLIEECLVRPVIVERLTRGFFAYDRTLHSGEHHAAQELREALQAGRVDPWSEHPGREVLVLVAAGQGARARGGASGDPRGDRPPPVVLELTTEELAAWSGKVPALVGEIGPLVEEQEAFLIRVLLEKTPDEMRIATYAVKKKIWDKWWQESKAVLGEVTSAAVATTSDPLPETITTSTTSEGTWTNDSPGNILELRSGHTAVWTGSMMIVWGGSQTAQGGERYNPATDAWGPTSAPLVPIGLSGHTAVWTGSLMVVWGGQSYLDRGARYDPVADTWAPTSTINAPLGRYEHTAVWTGSRMIVWGGSTGAGLTNTGGQYDPVNDVWMPTSTVNAPSPRRLHTAIWTGSQMIVWGGTPYDSLGTGGRYDPLADAWTFTSSVTGAPLARYGHTAVWTGRYMVVWGGAQPGIAFASGGRYDPGTDTWLGMTSLGCPTARSGHSAVWTGRHVIVWGGANSGGFLLSGGRYDPEVDAWSSTSLSYVPSSRYAHSAIWTGLLMIVWGGSGVNGLLNTGGRYNPAADSWTPTSVSGSNIPTARYAHTAVWTGSRMIVWGGSAGFFYQYRSYTGGLYDPALNTWSPTSLTNAPSGRLYHSAVWTGTVMVVWGGQDLSTSGGRYDPLTDTWAPTSQLNSPTGRFRHSAVWAASQMIVWGGTTNGSSFLDTGGRYDPTTDTWQGISGVAAPTARGLHTAVWTGNEMILWGGYNSVVTLNTGGRYRPATDTWTPTALAPAGRSVHTAVWTGNLMIVWGGIEVDAGVSTGGRYDPAAGSWTPTTVANAPSGRSLHTAVWTGDRMIVWGGTGEGPTNTGGEYDPAADTWTSTSTVGAPEARYEHTAIFTGDQMIVWGGKSLSQQFENGGRYLMCAGTTYYQDVDGDGIGNANAYMQSCVQPIGYVAGAGDCNDADDTVWGTPDEALDLSFLDETTLLWSEPADPGGSLPFYDLLRSDGPLDFVSAATCVASDTPAPLGIDAATPALGAGFFYLVRAQNGCPNGDGPLGYDSSGTPHAGRACP